MLDRGLDFLRRSVRPGGSWPIDTNLSTWLTTLSVNALRDRLSQPEREAIAGWLLGQQNLEAHPYTGAAPGAWAWTDLPGGVPDADDTAGALLALDTLGFRSAEIADAAAAGVRWLLDLQNRDGGIPTFCRGWGKLPFDQSSADITAHALQAWSAWRPALAAKDRAQVDAAIARAVAFLERAQQADGAWTPLWFGNQFALREQNPVYGTSRVLLGLRRVRPESPAVRRGIDWLIAAQKENGGWGGDPQAPASIEETAVAVSALADAGVFEAAQRGAAWIAAATGGGEETPPSPIGLYFARLWYYEVSYPLIFAVDALTRVAGQSAPGIETALAARFIQP